VHLNSCRTALTVVVASRNNLAQIELSLGSYSAARESLLELSRLLHGVHQQSTNNVRTVFSTDVWDGLLSNTLMIQAAEVAPAA
jgi:hypothetical protein